MKKRNKLLLGVVLPVAVIIGLLLMNFASAAVVLSETFEDSVANGFTNVSGTWDIITDGTKVYHTNKTDTLSRTVAGDSTWTNYIASSKVKVTEWDTTGGNTVGVMARYVDTNNYYLFIYENSELKIVKKQNGVFTTLANMAYTFNLNTWYEFRAELNGNNLKLYLATTLKLTATDSTSPITAGKAGVVSCRGNSRYDDVTVDTIVTATSTPTPTLAPASTPTPTPTPGATVKLGVSSFIGASKDDGSANIAQNTVDGLLTTRWSADSTSTAQWIKYDLGSVRTVDYVKLAWYAGDARRYTFDIHVSTDNVNWTQFNGRQSSGTTTALETHDITNTSARYVKIIGHGSNVNGWTSMTEAEIYGYGGSNPTVSLDQFGVKMLLPTKTSGSSSWFLASNPNSDPQMRLQRATGTNATQQTQNNVTYWTVQPKPFSYASGGTGYTLRFDIIPYCSQNGSISTLKSYSWDIPTISSRQYMCDPAGFKNSELTGYFRLRNIVAGREDDLISIKKRGGDHTDSEPDKARCSEDAVCFNGTDNVLFMKELSHPNYAEEDVVNFNANNPARNIINTWVGVKAVCWNNDASGTSVTHQVWVDWTPFNADGSLANNWQLLWEFVDTQATVVNWAGVYDTIRIDNAQNVDFTKLSEREVIPPWQQ